GKILTSLVVKPGEARASGAGHKWSKSLSLFRKALSEALLESDEKVLISGAPIRAAELETIPRRYDGAAVEPHRRSRRAIRTHISVASYGRIPGGAYV